MSVDGIGLLLTWYCVWVATSVLIRKLVPDPALQIAGPMTPYEARNAFSAEFGLDRPVWEESALRAWRMIKGEWGVSWSSRLVVRAVLSRPTLNSLTVAMAASMMAVMLAGLSLLRTAYGRATGTSQSHWASLAAASVPSFVWALWIQYSPIQSSEWGSYPQIDKAFLAVASLTLTSVGIAVPRLEAGARMIVESNWFRFQRSLGMDPLKCFVDAGRPYMLAASGDALAHCLLANLLGAVAVEFVLSFPGLGTVLVDSIQVGDVPVIMGVIAITSGYTLVVLLVRLLSTSLLPESMRSEVLFRG